MRQGFVEVQGEPVNFGKKLASSDTFKGLFRNGMALVEATASYLDGPGRDDAKRLPRSAALAYAAESMRLTTRLMQLASWLLLQRAVNEGEMTQAEAAAEKHRVRLSEQDVVSRPAALEAQPPRLRELIDTSLRLQAQIMRFDLLINRPLGPATAEEGEAPRIVESQIDRLRAAFEA
jgi:regulator of CtrA degradation